MNQTKSKEEYLMIREEIIHYYDIIQNLRNVLYVSLAAILTFAVSSKEPLLCLIPYCIIIPIYIVTIDYQYGMWRMGTYLLVFHEGEIFNWETRLHNLNISLNKRMNRHASSYHWPFIITGICCDILFFLKLNYKKIYYKSIAEIIFCVLISIIFLVFVFIQKNPDQIKSLYIEQWKIIKESGKCVTKK